MDGSIDPQFSPGQRVRIIDGPFETFEGVILEIDDRADSVTVEVSVFGKITPVDVPRDALKPLD